MTVEPVSEFVADGLLNEGLCFGVAQFGFCLTFELRFGEFDRDNCRESLADIVTGEVLVFFFEKSLVARIAVDQGGECRAEPFFVSSALVGVDGVGVGVDAL